jgi:mono/diheme cytochrome c family protein
MKRATMRMLTTAWTCATVALILTGCSERIGKGWDWNRMRVQEKYQPYRHSSFFADGKTMQLPPAGTVSREGGKLLMQTAPLAVTPAVLENGREQFHIYCAVCHGERGDGNSIVARNMGPPEPPSLVSAPASTLPASTIVNVITDGFGRMPSFAAELTPLDRIAVAEYVKVLQRGASGVPGVSAASASVDSSAHSAGTRP